MSFSLFDYGRMLSERPRVDAFVEALRRRVGPDTAVLDLGTGTGFFAVLAAKLGARRVVAIESDSVIEVARDAARENGVFDRIEFFEGRSTDIDVGERVDVVVADLRGVLPFLGDGIAAMLDARDRFLRPGGAILPGRDLLRACLVEQCARVQGYVDPWEHDLHGVRMRHALARLRRLPTKVRLRAEDLVAPERSIGVVDYAATSTADFVGSCTFTVQQAARVAGVAVWFDADFGDGVGFSNSPSAPPLIYAQLFFPCAQAFDAVAGAPVTFSLRAHVVGGDTVFVWRVDDGSGSAPEQTNLAADLHDVRALVRRAPGFVPVPVPDAAIEAEGIALMDGTRTVQEIAAAIAHRHPARFASAADALDVVAALSARVSR
jgi:type I protein arginine methyltransferase